MRRPRQDEGGAILVMTLIIVTLILVLASDARHVARMEIEATYNADVALKLDYALKAGYHYAEAHLRQDLGEGETDSLEDGWAQVLEVTLDPEEYGAFPLRNGEGVPIEDERKPQLRVFVHDEDRKWPLTVLLQNSEAHQKRRLQGLASVIDGFREETNLDVNPGQAREYADLIYEFLKRGERDTGFGPTPRPETKTGGLLRVTDLALIPGIPPELVFDQVDEENLSDHVVARGLLHHVTIWSDLAINVNTASLPVLRGIFRGNDRSIGDDIYKARGEKTEELRLERDRFESTGRVAGGEEEEEELATGPFETVDDVKEAVVTLTDVIFNESRTMMTTKSRTFSIWVEARLGEKGPRRVRRWIVRRDGPRIVPLLAEDVTYPWYREPTQEELDEPMGVLR